jgi:molecular chaperone DnaK (HSP70)
MSVLIVEDGLVGIRPTNGETHLGGEDFDRRVIEHFTPASKRKIGKDCTANRRAIAKLNHAVEKAKEGLSSLHQVTL